MAAIPSWRLQISHLDDPTFKGPLGEVIGEYFRINQDTAQHTNTEWEAFKVVVREFSVGQAVGLSSSLEHELTGLENNILALERELQMDPLIRPRLAAEREKHATVAERFRALTYR